MAKRPSRISNQSRRGFTMIELMVVIVIIAILVSLIVPAVRRSIIVSRNASVSAEISQLENAIASFKATHGIEPPSSITLYESSAGWASDTTGSTAVIRQLWPTFDFGNHDINGDGNANGPWTLTVGECLVFFLGGMNGNTVPGTPTAANNNIGNIGACTGFSKNPASPFDRGGTREAALFEFSPSRFVDINGNGFPEYVDTLPGQTLPYLYYSSYDGQGYNETGPTAEFDTTASGKGLSSAYRQGTGAIDPRWKPNSHQIVSPGYDKQYGYGGTYIATGSNRLPLCAAPTGIAPVPPAPTAPMRAFEADNITNFSSGTLQP